MNQELPPSPPKNWLRFLDRSEIPLAVYGAIFITMALLWIFRDLHEDVTLGFFTELLGAAFTLFIIDTLLVRSKIKRWKIVQEHIDYLIARDINRLRDGLAMRAFGFEPVISGARSEDQLEAVREQRAALLTAMENMPLNELASAFSTQSLFTENTYSYLDEKAGSIWDVLNMRYSEYMDPELVSTLMQLHTHIKDLCGHLRQYARTKDFPEDAAYYQAIGLQGASVTVRGILEVVNELKRQGYSKPANITTD